MKQKGQVSEHRLQDACYKVGLYLHTTRTSFPLPREIIAIHLFLKSAQKEIIPKHKNRAASSQFYFYIASISAMPKNNMSTALLVNAGFFIPRYLLIHKNLYIRESHKFKNKIVDCCFTRIAREAYKLRISRHSGTGQNFPNIFSGFG